MANEVIGLDIGIKLDGFREEMSKIPGITAENAKAMAAALNKSIKEAEKASKAAAAATKAQAEAAKKAEQATKAFGNAAGGAGEGLGKLASMLGQLSPGAAAVAGGLGDAAEMAKSAQSAFAAMPGPLLVVTGVVVALAAAFDAVQSAIRREAEAAAFSHEVNRSLVPGIRAVEDAQLDLAVALQQVTEAQGAQQRAAIAAQRGVVDYGESQKGLRAELAETIADHETFVGMMKTVFPDALVDWEVGVLGLSNKYDTAKTKIGQLDDAVEKNAASAKTARTATQKAAEAHELLAWAQEKGTDSAKKHASATDEAAGAMAAAKAAAAAYQTALGVMAGEQARAEQQGQDQFERLRQQRIDAIAKVAAAEQQAVEAALGNQAALDEAYAASAAARLAIDEAYESQRDALLAQYMAQQEERAAAAHEKTLLRAQQQREAIVGAATSMMGSLSELASIKAQDTSKKDAERARRQFRVAKGLAIAEAMVNAGAAATRAFRDWRFPVSVAMAAAAGVAAVASVARIRAIEPSFHAGGMASDLAPDEVRTTRLTRNEGVLTARGVAAVGGPEAVRQANAGGSGNVRVVPILMDRGAPSRIVTEALGDPLVRLRIGTIDRYLFPRW